MLKPRSIAGSPLLVFLLFLNGFSPSLPTYASKYVQIEKAHIPALDRFENFSLLYGTQWFAYVLTQRGAIQDHGSFSNWYTNPLHPHFDHDGMGYNLLGHTFVGQLYFQFYRSRGYSEGAAFIWAVMSSAAFEFSIETVTEPPSFQDLYQTPILGTLTGMGLERVSLFFHSLEVWPARALGYVFNPFTLFPFSQYGWEAAPILNPKAPGANVTWRF